MLGPLEVAGVTADHQVEELFLLGLQRLDAFLDGAGRDHAVDEDRVRLADAVHPVDRLVLHRGVPPRVEQEHIIGGMQRDARAGGLQAHQHGRRPRRRLEILHRLLPVHGHAGDLIARQLRVMLDQRRAHPVEQRHELREDDHLVPAGHDLLEFLHEQLQLAAVRQRRVHPREQVGVAAYLPQPGEQREETEGFFAQRQPDVLPEARQALGADAGVFGALHVGERAEQVHLDLGRQFRRHLVLGAAQDERRHLLAQAVHGPLAVLHQRRLESGAGTEQAGQDVAEDGPEIELPVLQRCARQHEPVLRADGEAGLRDLGVGILDELPLVEHRVAELGRLEHGAVLAQLGVAREPDARRLVGFEIIARLENVDLRLRIKPRQLLPPHRHHAGRAHDHMAVLRERPRAQQRDDLGRLAQAHLVGEQAVALGLAEVVHPLDAAALVVAEIVRQLRRRGGRRQHLLAPGLDLGAERDLDPVVVEQGENQVGRNLAGGGSVGEVAAPLVVALELFRAQRDDTEVGQQHRRAAVLEQRGGLLVGEQSFPGPENPAQVQAGVATPVRHGLDLDGARARLDDVHLHVELDGELLFPVRQQVAQEAGDVGQRVERVGVGGLVVTEVGLAGVGGQRDELGALGGGRVIDRVAEGGDAAAAALPVGEENQAVVVGREAQQEVARRRVGFRRAVAGSIARLALAVAVAIAGLGLAVDRGAGLGCGAGQQRAHFVHQQFLDLVQTRHGDGVGQQGVG